MFFPVDFKSDRLAWKNRRAFSEITSMLRFRSFVDISYICGTWSIGVADDYSTSICLESDNVGLRNLIEQSL